MNIRTNGMKCSIKKVQTLKGWIEVESGCGVFFQWVKQKLLTAHLWLQQLKNYAASKKPFKKDKTPLRPERPCRETW